MEWERKTALETLNHQKIIALNSMEQEQKDEDEYTMTEEKEELMIPPTSNGNPTFRKSHFLKPLLNPKNQSLPKITFPNLSSNPNIKEILKRVCFKGRSKPQRSWKTWVEDLQQTHETVWKKVGIFDAVRVSTYKIMRDDELIICLAEKWCTKSNTFMFSWGESTISLEDVMILGGFSVLGNSVFNTYDSSKTAEVKGKLVESCSVIRRNCNNQLSFYGWMDYYKGMGGELEHVALIVLWLSRYVLCSCFYIVQNVFGIAINLVMGTKFALAPVVLASIYRDLTLLSEKILCYNEEDGDDDGSKLVLWAPFHLVQLWAWERFPELSPKPATLVHGEPRAARWHNVAKLKFRSLRVDIESAAADFLWRPYTLCLKNWNIPNFYCDDERWVMIDSEVDEELLSFVRCLRVNELVGLDCVMQYLPHRVGMQFGLDQDIPSYIPRSDSDAELAWSRYAKPLEGLKLYLPPRLFEGDVTMLYSRWWRPPVLALENDPLITYVRRKRSTRKVKKISRILEGCSSTSFGGMTTQEPLNVVHEISSNIGLNPLNVQDATIYDPTTIAEVEEGMEVNGRSMLTEGGSKHSEGTKKSCSVQAENNHVAEDTTIYDPNTIAEEEQGMKVNGCSMTKEGGSKFHEGTKELCALLAEDDHVIEDTKEGVMKQAYDATVDVEDENDDLTQFKARGLVLESRISKLETIVFRYKAAKYGSKAKKV